MIACFLFPQAGVAVERTRAQNLWGEPFALHGSDGVIQVVSDEAARLGVSAGQKVCAARALCPGLLLLPYDRGAYDAAMQTVWDALAVESSLVEPVSAEEVYVEFDGPGIVERVSHLVSALALRLRIPVQCGLARTKLTAFHAARSAIDDPVAVVPAGLEADFLATIAIADVPQIEPKLRSALHRLGIHTLGDLLRLPPRELQRQFKARGLWLQRLAHGEDGERVRALWPPRRLLRSVSFEEEVTDWSQVCCALERCSRQIAAALKAGREFTRSLALQVVLADGAQLHNETRLIKPLDDAEAIQRVALRLMKTLPIESPLIGIGISAGDLGSGTGIQLTLLDGNESGIGYPHERRRRLEEALIYCRARFGMGAVTPLRLLHQAKRIHRWTDPLARAILEPIYVAANPKGAPLRYYHRGRRYEVKHIQNRWRETEWFWDALTIVTVYRVETQPAGLYELHRIRNQWRIGAVMD